MVIVMANTPELTPEPQDFPPVASTSLLKLTSNESEGAPPTADLVTNSTVAETIIYRSIGIFEQFIQDYDQQAPHMLGRSPSPATLTQSEFDLNKKNYTSSSTGTYALRSGTNADHGSHLCLPIYFHDPTDEEVSQYDPYQYATSRTSRKDDTDNLRDFLNNSTL